MAAPGRGRIACTPTKQRLIVFMVAHGATVKAAAAAYGMSDVAVFRQARRDGTFRAALTVALGGRARPGRWAA